MPQGVIHKYDPTGGAIAVNVSVGQALASTVRVSIYGPDGHFIDDIANVAVMDSAVPEYAIDKKYLKLGKFTILQRYESAGGGPGDFQGITYLVQSAGGVVPPVQSTPVIPSTGYVKYNETIWFEAAS